MKKFVFGLGLPIALFGLVKFADAATLTLTPASGSFTANQTFNVNINLDTTGQTVDGVDVYSLHFNPAILQVVDANGSTSGVQITPGTLMPQTLTNTVDNTTGTLQFSQVTTGGTSYTGSGVLATINFRAVANGTSSVTFDFTPGSTSDTNAAGGGTDRLTSVGSGSYTVTGGEPPPTPTPTPPPPPTPTPIPPPPPGYTLDASKYPSGMFIKYASDATVYLLSNGSKLPITDWTVYQNRVPTSRFIITIPDSVTFPTGAILGLRTGTLVKSVSNPTVYLFDGANRLAFTNQNDFLELGYRFNQVYAIDDDTLFTSYPIILITKQTFTRPNGTLFKYANDQTVYYNDLGNKRAFTSMFMFKAWYDRLDQIVTIKDSETYPDGQHVLLPNGIVVKTSSTATQHYIIAAGQVRPIDSGFMNSMGIQNTQVLVVSQGDLDRHGAIGAAWQ